MAKGLGLLLFLLAFVGLSEEVAAQQLPKGRFMKDTLKLGEPVEYLLTFKHPSDMEVVFPDSSHDFSPFEFLEKKYFPTQTDSTGSLDSVIYVLATFELPPVQHLAVPVFVAGEEGKMDTYNPFSDSIWLQEVVTAIPDSVVMKENTTWAIVQKQFNFPLLWLVLATILIWAIVLFIIFNKPIRKKYKLGKMNTHHLQFLEDFEELVKGKKDHQTLNRALLIWKTYTGKLIDLALVSFTTKEINGYLRNDKLHQSLRNIDKAIYSGVINKEIEQDFELLKEFTVEKYNEKVEELKNG
ncbi:hypothetical protein R9C00_22480 [Flammeovirgaceae bacterium SG7u.111]|nr:hypothetical protein [Flammeovirgaceae bacterium SG7u.132]WPO34471.1 hypothetical protein R9C00_22480 [Flammeovirgaceae bacterium SG7u.111]